MNGLKVQLAYHGDGGDGRVEMSEFPVLIGRQEDCAIRLDDRRASRRHASIELRDGKPCIVDLDSGNGTFVNDLRSRECFLAPGDEIRIGGTALRIERITRAAGGAEGRARAERRMRLRRRVGRLAPAVILLAAGGIAAWILLAPPGPPGGARPHDGAARSGAREAALREMGTLQRLAGTTPQVDEELLERARRARRQYAGVELPRGSKSFEDLLVSLRCRRDLECSNRLFAAAGRVRELLDAGKYKIALETARWEAGAAARDCPALKTAARNVLEKTRRAVDAAYRRVEDDVRFLAELGRYREGVDLCVKSRPPFEATDHAARLDGWIAKLRESEARLREKAELARRKLEDAAAARTKAARAEASRKADAVRKEAEALLTLLAPRIRDGVLVKKTFRFGGVEGRPVGVAEGAGGRRELVVAAGDVKRSLAFSSVPFASQLEMALAGLEGGALLEAARLGYQRGFPEIAGKLLWRYVSAKSTGRAARQARADPVLAAARGLDGVPEGGFTYTAKVGWEDARQRAEREALAQAERLGRTLARTPSAASLARTFAKVENLLEDGNRLSAASRSRVRQLAIDGLAARREKLIGQLVKRVEKSGFANLRQASVELNRRRAEALRIIYDTKIYLPEDHPDYRRGDHINGQEAVDKAVGAVRELWENAAAYTVTLDASSRKMAALLEAIDGECFRKLRHHPPRGESASLQKLLLNLGDRIDLKHYAANRAEADAYRYNRKVEAYNKTLDDPELPEADRQHVIFLNDYREMMGRRRLFIDLRLCRATRKHSAACNAAGRIWHNGPDGSPSSRARAEGFGAGVAENVAIGYGNPRDIWTRGWYRASDHHRNALGARHNCMGYGYVGRAGTQNFAVTGAPFQ